MISHIKKYTMVSLYYLMRVFPIHNDRIVIDSFWGKGYGDNGKYIAEELLKHKPGYDIVWLVNDMNYKFPKGIRKVKYLSLKAIYEMATARIWIDNARKPPYVRKRKGQFYIMTWHAGIGFKRAEKDVESVLPSSYVALAKADSKMADLFVSNSKWQTWNYRTAYWYDGEIAEVGIPREDIFFNADESMIKDIKQRIGLPEDVKILFYAPTFRKEHIDNQSPDSMKVYNLDWENALNECRKKFGGEWVGLIRLHPNMASMAEHLVLPDSVKNVTAYPDMQELLLAADCMITDYSSCIVDYSLTRKPAFLYASDFNEFKEYRDFYFDLEKLPYPLSTDAAGLIRDIKAFDKAEYEKRLSDFLDVQCGVFKGGKASAAIAERIASEIRKHK